RMGAVLPDLLLMVAARDFEPAAELRLHFDVRTAHSLVAALAALKVCTPQIVLIAEDVPDAPALTLLRALIHVWHGPYVLLADDLDTAEEIIALEAGFDDVWRASIDQRLALARARVLLRRSARAADASLGSLHAFGIALDRARRVVAFQQRELTLSPREADVLATLLRQTGRVVERSAFAAGSASISPASVDMAVARLRRRLAALDARHVSIEPVRGRGYCMRLREAAAARPAVQALRGRG
ncbi:MAG TPA: winged helix-turn-helix domain-containing protein, partial [Burkholderiaceae bacterium]|nr:winged helix-turn-helix domain-containing protein [Burkholderiaceae bacterium]